MIIYDSSNASSEGLSTTSRSWSHTVGVGSHAILIVGTNQVSDTANTRVSGITYNGIALTNAVWTWNGQTVEIWYLVNPTVGAHTVAVTWNSGGNDRVYGASLSYFNVATLNPINATNTRVLNGQTTASISETTTVSSAMLIDALGVEQESLSITSGQTQRVNATLSQNLFGMSEKLAPVPGTNTTSWTINGGNSNYEMIGVALRPVNTGGAFLYHMI